MRLVMAKSRSLELPALAYGALITVVILFQDRRHHWVIEENINLAPQSEPTPPSASFTQSQRCGRPACAAALPRPEPAWRRPRALAAHRRRPRMLRAGLGATRARTDIDPRWERPTNTRETSRKFRESCELRMCAAKLLRARKFREIWAKIIAIFE